ncbi:sulfide/dihydroorotate dehydrogenase-like FAD/NAD-binding protein [Thermodesulforhabdus norvegica]|uniref:Sulfide dehydrogenase (Flavoprotein) subunit SudB n=1 Tax=Thermodesulforhabdus norvegica TaxID=39841 RepID=A0A1I4RCK4_9BACT|nr:sulfide/dihydroorotate dehydrogenase-like FAD/NAD-binding protein [Thermodesulforhabdus norvegica]SFM49971.1 sulfide dehydrogenase (flavoprotein) subunit SudB [Thermodesulforhabdus norvegica]
MFKIVDKKTLSPSTKLVVVRAPHVAKRARPGQFVMIQIDESGERIPLTIADFDRRAGTVTMIFQEVGKTTMHLGTLRPGDELFAVAGPLGHPSEIALYGKVLCIGGGVGIAPIFPIARALKEAGNTVLSIIGARTKDLLFWEDRMASVSDELIICTDDGSYGRKAVVTQPLQEILMKEASNIARIWAIGPAVMMKFVCKATEPYGIPTIVSLNTIMVDGTGMCGSCRVDLKGETKFVCVDGPEFDGHLVNWENLLMRLCIYREEEQLALNRWLETTQGVIAAGGKA